MQVIKFGMEEQLGMRIFKKLEIIKLLEKRSSSLVKKYDKEISKNLFTSRIFLEYLDISGKSFWKVIEKHRNPNIWEKSLDRSRRMEIKG